jgi:hypothetical protein
MALIGHTFSVFVYQFVNVWLFTDQRQLGIMAIGSAPAQLINRPASTVANPTCSDEVNTIKIQADITLHEITFIGR